MSNKVNNPHYKRISKGVYQYGIKRFKAIKTVMGLTRTVLCTSASAAKKAYKIL